MDSEKNAELVAVDQWKWMGRLIIGSKVETTNLADIVAGRCNFGCIFTALTRYQLAEY